MNAGVDIVTGHEVSLNALRRDADLCIIADGAHSILRSQTGMPGSARLPFGCAVGCRLTRTNASPRPAPYGSGIAAPIKCWASCLRDNGQAMAFLWSVCSGACPRLNSTAGAWQGLGAWKSQIARPDPNVEDVLDAIGRPDELTWRTTPMCSYPATTQPTRLSSATPRTPPARNLGRAPTWRSWMQ